MWCRACFNKQQIDIMLRWLSRDNQHKYTENIRKFVQKQMDKKENNNEY